MAEMAEIVFSTENPSLTWLTSRQIWRTCEPLAAVWRLRCICVPEDFETDLASIPRVFRSLFPQNGRHVLAAIFHDFVYVRAGEIGDGGPVLNKADADKMFLDMMTALGVGWFKRRIMYRAVRLGGRGAW